MTEKRMVADIKSARDINSDNLKRLLASHYGDQSISIIESDVSALVGTNEFFNSEITKASIKITSDESNGDDETIHLVLKSPVSKGLIRLMHKMARPFVKETIFYKRGLPYLARYHPVIKTLVPECLLATVNVENSYRHGQLHCLSVACFPLRKAEDGIIILEDLTQQRGGDNYSLFDKGAILTYDQVKVALESLAHFHGAWWQALHGKGGVQPKEASADLTAKDLKDLYGDKLPRVVVKDFISSTLMSMAQLMENSGRDPAAAARLRRFGQSNADDGATAHIFALTQDSKFKTIIHGDFWSNNIMFHYDKEGKPDKVRFFDFQLMAMVHPVQDICYFLYINTDKCFREKYLDLCLRSYYAVLQNYLIGQEFSYNMFKKEFDEHRLGGMLFGLMTMPNVLSPNPKNLIKFGDWGEVKRKRHAEISGPDKEDDHPMVREIRRRLLDVTDEFQEFKII